MRKRKLSEAIREGGQGRHQARGAWYWPHKACALQAAVNDDDWTTARYQKGWEWIEEIEDRVCPACGHYYQTAMTMILHLNDIEEWTFEQIAEWVESVEP